MNVDISTQDLRQRMEQGKIYASDRVETALNSFFTGKNLEHLREIALRELASRLISRRRAPEEEESCRLRIRLWRV